MVRTLLIIILIVVLLLFFKITIDDAQKWIEWATYPLFWFVTTELFQLRTKHPFIYLGVLPILLIVSLFYKCGKTNA